MRARVQQDRIDGGQITSEKSGFRLLQLIRGGHAETSVFFPGVRIGGRVSAPDVDHKVEGGRCSGLVQQGRAWGGGTPHLPLRIHLRGLFIELYIQLRLQNSDLRIVGFRNTFENWQAPPEAYVHHVRDWVAPPGIRRTEVLPFGGGRFDLEAAADVRRSGISLGRRPLSDAVVWLHRNRDPKCTAHGILVLSEMLCEAARYPALADAMSRIWMTGGRLSADAGVA